MRKNELERIALDCLERIETEAREGRRSQDAKIQRIETRVEDFERQLTRLSGSLRSLRPLTD
ncbi:MAG: hypothetical protein LBT97_02320, partial [Planctomycetota bacterium]|nr:hypothetical protein [Planctomycetota bacterium]